MNKTYKSIFNKSTGTYVAVSETFEAGETVEVLADVVKINSIIDA